MRAVECATRMSFDERLPWLRGLVARGPAPLFATVSGAHLYGFESSDSDWDLRGAFVAPLESVLGLRAIEETVSVLETRDGLELDWVAHDVRKFARLMTRRNGYVLEQVFSPLVVHGGAWLDELRAIARGCVTRTLFHHYDGFVKNQLALLDGGDATVKRLLYCYRVLLSGIHVLRAGRIEANLGVLSDEHGLPSIAELIERKRAGRELGALAPREAEAHRAVLDALRAKLADAHAACTLPEEPTSLDALDAYVVRARMELGRG